MKLFYARQALILYLFILLPWILETDVMNRFLNLHNGKNSKLLYYLRGIIRNLYPAGMLRRRLPHVLKEIEERPDSAYIHQRAAYYNQLRRTTTLPHSAPTIGKLRLKGNRSVYFFDSYEYLRWFPKSLRWCYVFGDVTHVPSVPSIVKSRPLETDNTNSVLLNMDKVRHFIFLKDKIPFEKKQDKIIFRGAVDGKARRIDFVKKYYGHPMCDVGDVEYHNDIPHVNPLTLHEHLTYKFIISLEGNDVASNLKWVMSSNSIAVMPRPTCETWFMEGTLIPDYHYIEIKPDYSDLIEKTNYYIAHPDEAQDIINHAHDYVRQFRNPKRERLISLLVLDNYFKLTNG